jgi:hypothetical protein
MVTRESRSSALLRRIMSENLAEKENRTKIKIR